jgi:protein-S-isoprenylcysteine O-methyltransferase Ste14
MSEEGPRKEGLVRGVLKKGDLTTEQMKEELWEKNISFVRSYDRAFSWLFLVVAVFWFLPAIAKYSGWQFLDVFAQLPTVDFPIAVIVIGAIFFITAIALEAKVNSGRKRRGGCHDYHETLVIVREGPYRVIRHPGYLAEMVYFSLLPILLSKWLPFTSLAVISIAVIIASFAFLIRAEDNFNTRKWGEEYRRYMKEVPALNFVKGLKNLRNG